MLRKSSAIQPSRYAPYSRAPPAHPSSSSSNQDSLPSSGLHTASHPANIHPSTGSAHHHPSTPAALSVPPTSFVTRYPSVPQPNAPPISVTQSLSTPAPRLEHSTFQGYSFTQQPTHLPQLPFPQDPYHYPYPAMNIPHPHPPIFHPVHLPLSAQSIQREQPSVTFHQPEDQIYQNHSVHQHPLNLVSASTQQGPTYYSNGMFSKSWGFSVNNGTFIDNSTNSDNFMRKFLQDTIIGAEFDSSDRYPPPRCHPGTRLAILQRCKAFVMECSGKEKLCWVVGPAGVGKSAIMQMVAEETPADASVFLSVNGRQDGWKTLTTIAYQLAAKHEPYNQFIRNEITRDPSLLRKLLPAQFNKFIVEPFVHRQLFNPSRQFLIIIDGLDECDNPITPLELLELISGFCITYPNAPVVWFIASRPEPHITSFFDNAKVALTYTKEEILINSDEACEDVQMCLRDELNKIKRAYPALKHKREWPSELEFTKIASAAGGLFAYVSTVVRYISDPYYRDPVALLRHLLEDIDAGPKNDVSGRDHSMAQLDVLYRRILSNIPPDVMINTRKLLLIYSEFGWRQAVFRTQCNVLGLTDDAAYGALCHLHAVMQVPAPDKADEEPLEYLHESFSHFLFDFDRSGFCRNVRDEVEQLQAQCSSRIIKEVPDCSDGMVSSEHIACNEYGHLRAGSGFLDGISLSWPCDECSGLDDQLRRQLYTISMDDLCHKFSTHQRYRSIFSFDALTTRFTTPGPQFPSYELRDSIFNNFCRELKGLGKLKQVPLRAIDYAAICGGINLQFTWAGPVWVNIKSLDIWNSSCQHETHERQNGLQGQQDWSTTFARSLVNPGTTVECTDIPRFNIKAGKNSHWECINSKFPTIMCLYCSQRLSRHLVNNPDQLATVFVDSTEMCYVEFSFVDPDDSMSEWRYRFFHSGPLSCIN